MNIFYVKSAAVLAALLICVWLFKPPAVADGKSGVTTISFGTTGNPEQIAVYRRIVAMFEERQPGIRVQLRTPNAASYLDKLKTELAGRVGPDVMIMDVPAFYSLADKKVLRPLDEFIARDAAFRRDDYFPGILRAFTHEKQLYVLPKSCGSDELFYNQDHFDAAGLAYPDASWTWDDLLQAARRLTQDADGDGRNDRFGIAMVNYFDLLSQYNAGLLSPEEMRCTLSEPNAVQATQFLHDLIYKYNVMPGMSQLAGFGISFGGATTGGRAGGSVGVVDLFEQQKVSMIVADLVLSLRLTHAPFRWDVAVQPRGLRRSSMLNGAGYGMNARTRHPQEAWELIKWLAGPEVQALRAAGGDSLPSMPAIARSATFLNNPRPPANRQAVIDMCEVAIPLPYHPRLLYVMQTEMGTVMENMLIAGDSIPVEVALGEACGRIDRILREED